MVPVSGTAEKHTVLPVFTAYKQPSEFCSSRFLTPFFVVHVLLPLRYETLAVSDHWKQIQNTHFSLTKYNHGLGWDFVPLPFFLFLSSREVHAKGSAVWLSRIPAPSYSSGWGGVCLVLVLHFVVWIEDKMEDKCQY